MNKLGIVIGRFQPLHNGHAGIISKALEECEQVLVLVGSANKLPDFNNPFTLDERFTMIRNVFGERIKMCGLFDFPTDDEWVQSVTAHVLAYEEDPSKVTLYTSEKDAKYYQSHLLYNVEVSDSGGVHATNIRNDMYHQGFIEETKVPKVNLEFLNNYLKDDRCIRMREEKEYCEIGELQALSNHAFSNPIEPVAHAVVIHGRDILLVERNSKRGYGQLAIPGGFVEHTESTREAAIRELREETGLDLTQVRCREVAQALEENLDDLSVRTLGVNYLYQLDPSQEKPEITIDSNECLGYQWASLEEVLNQDIPLFYNHTTVVQRLFAKVGEKA